MNILSNSKSVSYFFSVALFFLIFSCSDSSSLEPESNWEYIGDEQVRVWQLDVDDSSSTQAILTITMTGDTKSGGRLSNCDIDAERSPTSVTLTVWAEVEQWVGSGVVPPYDTTIQCDYQASPPFEEGEFFIITQQPDGSQLTDSVLIVN